MLGLEDRKQLMGWKSDLENLMESMREKEGLGGPKSLAELAEDLRKKDAEVLAPERELEASKCWKKEAEELVSGLLAKGRGKGRGRRCPRPK